MTLAFVHAADFHILPEGVPPPHGLDAAAQLARAVPLINALRPACVVAGGDLADDGSEAAYRRLQALLEPLEAPVHFLLGNHDDRGAFRRVFDPGAPEAARSWGAERLGGVRCVWLDSAVPGEEAGRLAAEQLRWLEEELGAFPDDPTWLFLHHHPLPVHQRWLDRIGLREAEPLLELVARSPQVAGVCYGHVHQSRRWRYGRALLLGVPALAFQFAPVGQDAPRVTQAGAAFRRVELLPEGPRSWLHYLDGRVAAEPSLDATPVYVR